MEKKLCSATRGSSDGWKEEGKQMYFALIEKIKTLRKDPVTGSDFEHKLMVKWGKLLSLCLARWIPLFLESDLMES